MATLGNTPRPAYVYDTETDTWVPVGVGAHTHSDIPNTLVDAKGDLITATADNVPARLAKGSDGTVLVSDSSTSTGLAWQPYGAIQVAGKNKLINGDFNIWQRGTSLSVTTNAGAYLADRFLLNFAGTFTGTLSQQTFTPGTAPVAGYEGQFFQRIVRTGTTSCAPTFYQRVENVRTFASQTVTFSFWAKADAARSVGIQAYQSFGSGGSAAVDNTVGTASLTTSWQRFSFTYTMPSVAGKTISTSNDSWMTFYWYLPDSTSFTIDTWGWQLEAGSAATPFTTATGTIQGELAACQRYYYRITGGQPYSLYAVGFARTTGGCDFLFPVPVTMRSTPQLNDYGNLVVSSPGQGTFAISSITSSDQMSPAGGGLFVSSSGLTINRPYFLGNNNNSAGYLGISAEL